MISAADTTRKSLNTELEKSKNNPTQPFDYHTQSLNTHFESDITTRITEHRLLLYPHKKPFRHLKSIGSFTFVYN